MPVRRPGEVEDLDDDEPGRDAAQCQRDQRQQRGEQPIFERLPAEQLHPGGAQRLEDDAVIAARLARRRDGADQHGDPRQDRDRGGDQDGARHLRQDHAHLIDHVAHGDDRDARESGQQRTGHGGVVARVHGDGRSDAVRRGPERDGREDEDIVEAHRVPVDLAQGGDARLYFAAQDRNGQPVADAYSQRVGRFGVERYERRAAIVFGPPAAGDQIAAFGQRGAVGDAALAAQEPGAFGQLLQVGDALAAIGGDRAAQHGHDVELRFGRLAQRDRAEARLVGGGNVEHDLRGRLVRHDLPDFGVETGFDARQSDEQGEREAESDDERGGLRAGAVEIGERKPQPGALGPWQAPRAPPNRDADPQQ